MSGFPPITSHQQAMDLAEDLAWHGREWWNEDRPLDDPRDLVSSAVIYFARYTKALEQAIDELKAIAAVLAERAGVEVVNDPTYGVEAGHLADGRPAAAWQGSSAGYFENMEAINRQIALGFADVARAAAENPLPHPDAFDADARESLPSDDYSE